VEDLLGALLGGEQPPEREGTGPDEERLRRLLSGLLGDNPRPEPQGSSPETDPLAQLLQGMMGGQQPQAASQPAQAAPAPGGMDLGGLLGGLLGGGGLAGGTPQAAEDYGAAPETESAPGGLELGGLLGGLLGGMGGPTAGVGPGQAAAGAGGLGGIMDALLGGEGSGPASNSLLAPIVDGLAEKLGLPPQIAQAVVAFVLGKLMDRRLQPGLDIALTAGPEAARTRAASLEDVVQQMNRGQQVTKTAIRDAGLAEELAAHTGLDRATAEASLQEVLNALGGEFGAGQ
jgi:hypothetical protein